VAVLVTVLRVTVGGILRVLIAGAEAILRIIETLLHAIYVEAEAISHVIGVVVRVDVLDVTVVVMSYAPAA